MGIFAEYMEEERKKNMSEFPTDNEGKLFENQDNKGKKMLKKKCKKG